MDIEDHGRSDRPCGASNRSPLELRVLGPLVVARESTLSVPPAQRRLLAALAAFHPHPAPLSRLTELCGYPDPDGRRARRAVQTALWRLGKVVGAGSIDVDGELCQLAPDTAVDLARFLTDGERAREHLDAGRAADAREVARRALALWRGPLLADAPLMGELPVPAAAAESIRDDVTELLAAAALQVGDADDAIAVLEALVRRAPTRENAWATLIDAYVVGGFERDARRTAAAALDALDQVGLLPGSLLEAATRRASAPSQDRSAGRAGGASPAVEASAVPAWLRPADGPFLGRTAELDRLRAGVEHAASGAGQRLLIVSGEAGAGKTRLVGELATWAANRGMAVWAGRADQHDAVPYQAIAPVLRAAAQSPLVRPPDLGGPLDGLIRPDRQRNAGSDPLSERQALFEGATRLLATAASAAGSALIILEDIHWASADLLLLARHAMRSQPMPACVVLTVRLPGLLDQQTSALLNELASMPGSTWLGLEGLAEADLARLPAVAEQASRLGCDVADVARAVHRHTGGNALLVHHVVDRTGVLNGSPPVTLSGQPASADAIVDTSLLRVVEARLGGLDSDHRAVLDMAALQGSEFDAALLARITDTDVAAALDAGERLGIVRSTRDGRFEFRHQLVQEALCVSQSVAARARGHLRIARQIEASDGGLEQAFALSRHYRGARPLIGPEPAVRAAAEAAHRAAELLDFGLAARLYEQAAEDARPRPGEAARLHMLAANAWLCESDAEASVGALRRAVALAGDVHDVELLTDIGLAVADLKLRLARPLSPPARQLVDRVLALPDGGLPADRLRVFRALEDGRAGELDAVLDAHADQPAHQADLTLWALYWSPPVRRPSMIARLAAMPNRVLHPRAASIGVARWAHDIERGVGNFDQPPAGVASAPQCVAHDAWEAFTWFEWQSCRHAAAGRFARSVEAAERAKAGIRSRESGISRPWHPRIVAAVHSGQLRFVDVLGDPRTAARHDLEQIAAEWTEDPIAWRAGVAAQTAMAGDVERARDVAHECLARIDASARCSPTRIFELGALMWSGLLTADVDVMLRVGEQLTPWSGWHCLYRFGAYLGCVDLWIGVATVVAGELDSAVDVFESAVDQHTRVGSVPWRAFGLAALAVARSLRGTGDDRARAELAAREAIAIGQQIGSPHPADILEMFGIDVKPPADTTAYPRHPSAR